MPGKLLSLALNRTLTEIRYVAPVLPARATGAVADVYADSVRGFGMLAPPVALHSPAPVPLAASWLLLRETLIAPGGATRASREEVAAAVSAANACPYCVSVHTLMSRTFGGAAQAPGPVAAWIRGEGPPPREHLSELLGVAFTFHYLNRMVNVFLPESPLPSDVPSFAHPPMRAVLGRLAVRAARNGPGSVALLPEAPRPADLAWASGGDAVARAVHAVDEAVVGVLGPRARSLVATEIATRTRPPGLDRSWVDQATAPLPPQDRPAARLALLVALDSARVTAADVASFHPDDASLITVCSWAAMTAARRQTLRLSTGTAPAHP